MAYRTKSGGPYLLRRPRQVRRCVFTVRNGDSAIKNQEITPVNGVFIRYGFYGSERCTVFRMANSPETLWATGAYLMVPRP
jgi:hypothetical protein